MGNVAVSDFCFFYLIVPFLNKAVSGYSDGVKRERTEAKV